MGKWQLQTHMKSRVMALDMGLREQVPLDKKEFASWIIQVCSESDHRE